MLQLIPKIYGGGTIRNQNPIRNNLCMQAINEDAVYQKVCEFYEKRRKRKLGDDGNQGMAGQNVTRLEGMRDAALRY